MLSRNFRIEKRLFWLWIIGVPQEVKNKRKIRIRLQPIRAFIGKNWYVFLRVIWLYGPNVRAVCTRIFFSAIKVRLITVPRVTTVQCDFNFIMPAATDNCWSARNSSRCLLSCLRKRNCVKSNASVPTQS